MKLKIKKLIPDLDLRYHSDGASGIDISLPYGFSVQVGVVNVVRCGFSIEIPYGYEGQIRPRSSSTKNGLIIHLATIDSDYRGEVCLMAELSQFHNYNVNALNDYGRNSMEHITAGERIAQLVICPVQRCDIEFVDELSETKRGSGGFGSTGK